MMMFRTFITMRKTLSRILRLICALQCFAFASAAFAFEPYRLEAIEINGTRRIDAAFAARLLSLKNGDQIDNDLVMTAREKLLSLGLFKSVLLLLHRGNQYGWAKLVIEAEDDPSVLDAWAIGGALTLTAEKNKRPDAASDEPVGARFFLVSRNAFRRLHRAHLVLDVDTRGRLREGEIAYGFPRATLDDAQFDARYAMINANLRYLNALGFSERGEMLWSRMLNNFGQVSYGLGLYQNQDPERRLMGYPKLVVGPLVALRNETRLRGFIPEGGHSLGASMLPAINKFSDSVLQFNAAHTVDLNRQVWITLSGDIIGVGTSNYGLRAESRFDLPLFQAESTEKTALFLRLQYGTDVIKRGHYSGTGAAVGLRYRGTGLIAEIVGSVTRLTRDIPSGLE